MVYGYQTFFFKLTLKNCLILKYKGKIVYLYSAKNSGRSISDLLIKKSAVKKTYDNNSAKSRYTDNKIHVRDEPNSGKFTQYSSSNSPQTQ